MDTLRRLLTKHFELGVLLFGYCAKLKKMLNIKVCILLDTCTTNNKKEHSLAENHINNSSLF